MAEIKGIAGAKNNGGSKDNGQNRGTEIASVAYMKILLALSEGQIAGQFTGQDICLDGTPLLDADGHENFPGVTWEWRSGLVDQDYIQGFPAVENEISVSTEIKSGTPWVKAINNTQLSAVRLRIKFPNGVYSLRDSGGKDGYRIEFAIDVSTDGSTYTEYGRDTVDGIANTGYERSYRIDLPRANSGWQIRVRRLTENKNNNKTADVSRIESITEIVDAKLRYPNTALLFVQFDSTLFDGRTPTVTVKAKGLVIRVPSNYDPVERTYSGSWDGTFKWAWSNNPAWIFYDLVLNKRYGLGKRISSDQVDKWTLYQIGQYCDAPVSDGAGGKEARYLCDLYISQRTDAWTVLMDLANIFRGMISWSNNLLSVDADMPREMDPDFVFNKSNIVGSFTFSSTSERTNYSAAIVTYSNPQNNYQDDQASVYSQEVADRFGFNTIELSRIGCTRESEAQRHGAYAIETNRDDNGVEFKTGMEGRIPRVGKVIGINNAPMAGRQNGGRVAAVSGKRITLDRAVAAKAGDTLIINLPDGKSQGRKVQGVQDRIVTVEQEYNPAPQAEAGWILDQSDLAIQQFRVKRVVNNNDGTVTINGLPYNPNKFPRVDDGAVIEDRPVTVVPPRGQEAPDDITISSLYRVSQGIGITTLVATWSPVKNAIAYEMQWRQNNGDWINLPRTGNTRFEVDGIYTGRYVVRVRAINAQDIASVWGISKETELTGKSGAPLPPLALATRSLVHGVQVSWEFPTGSGDTLRTELQYSKNQDGSAPMPLSDVAYPGKSYQQMGLSMGAEFWYRARLVDRLGNESPWTVWVQGMASDNFDDYYENLTDAIKDTDAWEETQRTISETQEGIRNTQQELEQTAEELRQEAADQAKQVSQNIDASAKSITADVNQQIAVLSKSLADGDAALNAQIKTAENGLKQSLSQVNTTLTNAVKQETADRIADVNAKAAQAADQLLSTKNELKTAIDSLSETVTAGDENLAREMSSLAAGANIQFDSQVIWHFNSQTTEGWTGSAGVPGVSRDGWLRPANSATDPYITSPGGLAVDGAAYRFIMLRFRKTGKPVWAGEIRWVSAGENFNNTKRYIVAEPEYAGGVATLTVRDIPWTGNIDRIRLDLTNQQDASNFIEFDWIAVGRPAPGASTAALQDVRSTLSNALTAEAQARSTLAAQMRGSYDGSDLEKVTTGLLYQEKTARVTAIQAEVKARESLQTQFNDNKAAVSGELSSLTTEQRAQASRIGGLETSLGKKADATALTSLTQKVEQQGATLTSQGAALTSLTNRVGQTETGLAGTNEALSGLQSVVTRQGDRITSQGQSITKLTSDLGTINAALVKKAEAAAVTALTQQVEQNGRDIRSNTDSITRLSNQLVNGQPNSWSRRIYPVQLANAVTVPSFSDIRAVAPVVVDEVADATRLDFTSAGSYLIALYSCQVKVAADTTITMTPGNRVFDDTGAVFVNGVQVAWGNASWTTVSFDLKAGWNTVEFLVNQWAGQAYINLGLKLSDKVAEMYSGLGVSALANAAGVLSSNVSQIGNDVVSNSQSITQLRNALTQTDANVASKADQTAMNSLTGRVEKTESGLTAANSNITSLSSSLSQQSKRGANLLPDGTFESYAVGHNLANNRAIVTTDDSHGGNKCIRVTRPNDYNANATDNTDTHIFSGFQVRDNAVFYMECWVKLDSRSTAMAGNVQISVGLSLQYQDNSWQWPAVTRAAKDLSSTQWTKVSGYLKSTKSGIKQAMVRISIPNVSSVKAGNSFLIDDLVITEVTDAYNAQSTADANANAISTLNSTVSQQGGQITSQGNSITKLTNDLATTNNNVSNKADANALTALTNRVTQTEKDINSTSLSVTNLNNKVDAISVGGTNLIKNSGDMTGWSNVTSETYRGNAVIGATVKAGSGYRDLREITLESPVDAGEYVYSFYAKGGVAGQTMTAFFYNPNTTTSVETSQGAKGNNTDGRAYFTLTTSWARYWVKWKQTPTTGTKRLILCRIESNTSKDQTVYINSPKFEAGNVVSDWNESPSDSASASAVDSLTTTVNQHGTSISSIGNRTTSLENGLSTAQNNIARKADASALQDLRNTVTSQGGDLTAANSSITSLQASMNHRTVFTVTARGNGNSITPGVFDESGKNLFTPGRSWALVTFAKHSNGSTVIATSKTYDVFGSANNGATMSADIEALASGTYVCVLTFDEPSGNRGKILSALESLGGTSEVVNSLPYRGAYILLGRKGMRPGDGLELRAPTGGDATAHISTSVEFVNGVMMGLGAAGGVMMKADANASAITTLQNTVKAQGGNIDSLSSSVTALENSLRSTNDTVSKKADTSAVSSLTGRVSRVENTITSQSQSITSLTSTINTIRTQGANPWVDGTFESYGDGHVLGGGGTAVVVASQKFTGNKSLQVSRGANNNGNSDKQLGSWQSVREDAKFRFEFWAMMPADQKPSSGWTTLVGINSLNAAGQNSWQSAVTVSEAALGARDKWVKFTGIASNNGGGRTRAVVWISTRGASGSGTPGYSLYIDDLVITDVTDAKAAQDASDATASAVSGLTARVTDAEGKITAQAQQQAALATKVDNANSRVDNMAKTLSDSQNTQASLNTSLQSQIDAQAAANIKNQTTLDNTIKSVASITSTQQTHATALEALATQQTTLTSSVGDLSASVQNTAKTVAAVNGTVSSLWSMKVETVNGKKVGAGITLGSNGETSDIILYADRFSLFNRNNATAVPVMVAEGNELYIDTARIKNSSLTSTKIADGAITNAKIGNVIQSDDFIDGRRGWRITKDGSSQLNNVVIRGEVHANTGVLNNVTINETCTVLGSVQANKIVGDVVTMTDRVVKNWPASGNTSSGTRYLIATIDGMPFERRMVFNGSVAIVQVWRQNVTIRVDETTVWTFDSGNDGKDFETSIFSIRIPASNFGQRHQITIQWPNRGDSGQFRFTGVVSMYRTTGSISLA